jgi:preprotein translocase subunit SecA
LVEYKTESYVLFTGLMESIHQEALENLFHLATGTKKFISQMQDSPATSPHNGRRNKPSLALNFKGDLGRSTPEAGAAKTQRNSPCPCDSGKKYKQCCGRPV